MSQIHGYASVCLEVAFKPPPKQARVRSSGYACCNAYYDTTFVASMSRHTHGPDSAEVLKHGCNGEWHTEFPHFSVELMRPLSLTLRHPMPPTYRIPLSFKQVKSIQ